MRILHYFFSLPMSKLQNVNLISVEARPEVREVQVKVNKPATSGDLATWERVSLKSSKFCEQHEAALFALLFYVDPPLFFARGYKAVLSCPQWTPSLLELCL